jgi:hypothetical protein
MNTRILHNKIQTQPDFSAVLFWDTGQIDWERDAEWLVERVVEMGTLDDFIKIIHFYSYDKVKTILLNSRRLNERDLHFCSVYFDIEKSRFACYTEKSSMIRPLRYWNS